MQITDRLALADLSVTGEGFLVASATIARAGVQAYRAAELGIADGDPERTVQVLRPGDEVFAGPALDSFKRKPVTDGHPPVGIDAGNAVGLALGLTGDTVTRDGQLVRTTVTLFDAGAVDDVRRGRRQLSAGYSADIDWTPGVTDDGTPYDAVQRNIRGNHIALVDAGRCGVECRIGDRACGCSEASAACGGSRVKDTPTLTTIIHDGTALETTDAGARVIDELKAELITKDKELGARDAEIVRLKDEMKAVGDIDRLVAERADVIARARTIADHVEVTGLASPEIRRAAVAARLGETTVAERSDDYVEALFDSLVADADPLTDALRLTPAPAAGDPYRAYTERLANAWKMKEAH